jgi:glycosyltransferase involved in cell wall biosynthesis
MTQKPLLVFQAPVSTRSGYGDHSRDLLKSFKDLDLYDIKVISTKWGNCPMDQLNPDNEFHKWINTHTVSSLDREVDIYVQVTVPNEFQRMGKFNIGITAGIETNLVAKDWIDGCNKMDLIITTSEHSKVGIAGTVYHEKDKQTQQILAEHKLTKPIEVLFEGCDYHKTGGLELLDQIEEDFIFLFVGHWLPGGLYHDRKDNGGLIQTFLSAFARSKGKKPALVMKTSSAGFSVRDREEMRRKIEDASSKVNGSAPIYLLHGDLCEEDMWKLYNHPKVKASVSFTHGEGYGRPLLEFSLTGKPVVVSKWSGHLDFLDEKGAVLLEGQLRNVDESAANQFLLKDTQWFYVNYSNAAVKMLDIYKNYDKYSVESKKLGERNRTKFSMNSMTESLKKIANTHIKVAQKIDLILPD